MQVATSTSQRTDLGGPPGQGVTPTPTPHSLCLQAITARDSMAKSLYSALFDWIVLRINHALLNKKDMEESVSVRAPPPRLAPCDPGCSRSGVRLVSPLSSPREPTGCGSQGPVQRE